MVNPNWWQNAVIYQVYPRSFKDSTGDGVGDLKGIIEKLDYIASLNVDAVWISPFFKSPMKDFGYDISDYCAIEPMFGTMDDFKRLLDAAHQRDLKVLIDQVWNHTSDQHPWFVESRSNRDNPKADWYVWADPKEDGSPPNKWLATFGGIAWEWDEHRQQYYLHSFLKEQPDLNWYNPEVMEAIKNIARFWLDMGVDGFRLDVVNFFAYDRDLRDNPIRPDHTPRPAGADPNDPFFSYINLYNLDRPETIDIIKEIRKVTDEYPGKTTLAEISSTEDTISTSSEYVKGTDRLHMAYNSSLMTDEPLSYDRLSQMINRFQEHFQEGIICWTAGTHDFPRLKSRWQKYLIEDEFTQEAFAHMFAAFLISLPGSCCIYQGDELGLTQAQVPLHRMQDPYGIANYPHILGRDGCRTPMPWHKQEDNAGFTTALEPWLPIPKDHLNHAVNQQDKKQDSILNKYRRLLKWRKNQPALQNGHLNLIDTEEPVFAFTRECAEQKLLCLFNLSPLPVHYYLSGFLECEDAHESDFYNRRYEDIIEITGYNVYFGNFKGYRNRASQLFREF